MELVVRRYTFRLYPNATQAARMDEIRRMSCWLYNALVEQRRDAWDRCRKSLTLFDQMRECTLLANDPDLPEWKVFPSAIRERTAKRVDQAFKKYFDNVKAWRRGQWSKPFPPRPPKFQKSAEFSGFGLREHGKGWKHLSDRRIKIQSVGEVKMRGRFPDDPVELRTADVLWQNGRWEISIVGKFRKSGAMRVPTQPFSSKAASNSLIKTRAFVSIRCSNPSFEGEPQVSPCASAIIERCSNPSFEGEPQACSTSLARMSGCSNPSLEGEPQGQSETGRPLLGCSTPSFEGEPQVKRRSAPTARRCRNPLLDGKPQDERKHVQRSAGCSNPSANSGNPARKTPSRGRINRMRRWRNAIARRNHAMHEFTSYLAAHGGDIEVRRPPLLAATKTGKGSVADPGALVAFKAQMNRDLLDRGIGKLCELLAYKVEARGYAFAVTEIEDHEAMVPEAAASTAKLAKRMMRVRTSRRKIAA